MQPKPCKVCGREFVPYRPLNTICNRDECRRKSGQERSRKYRLQSPEKVRQSVRMWKEKNINEVRRKDREYKAVLRNLHPGKNREKCRHYQQKHRAERAEYQRQRRKTQPEKVRDADRKYREKHTERIREMVRLAMRKLRGDRAIQNLTAAINTALEAACE